VDQDSCGILRRVDAVATLHVQNHICFRGEFCSGAGVLLGIFNPRVLRKSDVVGKRVLVLQNPLGNF
jgi:hypothetical protein